MIVWMSNVLWEPKTAAVYFMHYHILKNLIFLFLGCLSGDTWELSDLYSGSGAFS